MESEGRMPGEAPSHQRPPLRVFLGHAVGFLALTGGFIFFAVKALPADGPVICTIKRLTGIGCPGCGLTRSIGATLRLDLPTALRYHAFGPVVVAGGAVLWVLLGLSLALRRNVAPDPNAKSTAMAALGLTALFLVYWGVRLVLGAVP